ncbi:MAG: tetratricopeptide repeat protein [bacterium]
MYEKEQFESAIEQCFAIMRLDKKWNEKAAYNFLLEIFGKLGPKHELVLSGRKKLAKLLF